MALIPIYTSLPPRISRQEAGGTELGLDYLQFCLKTWQDHGFDPVTVNAESEKLPLPLDEWGVRQITVKRDAKADFGKPFVYLHDFFDAIAQDTDGVVVITNADIFLDFTPKQLDRIKSIQPGEAVILHRQDTDSLQVENTTEYLWGYDFFAFHSSDLKHFKSKVFALGIPWWDYYVPITMRFAGIQHIDIGERGVNHLTHEERWNFGNYLRVANQLRRSFSMQAALSQGALHKEFLSELKQLTGLPIYRRLHILRNELQYQTTGRTRMEEFETVAVGKLLFHLIEDWRQARTPDQLGKTLTEVKEVFEFT